MNLFNKVKQGMIDSTKAIKEISSDVTELTKVKMSLSKDLTKIEELYYELGKKVYASYEKNNTLNLADDVLFTLMEIQSTLEKIKEAEAKIESLKGIVKCNQCGCEVDENTKYCSNCGNKLEYLSLEKIPQNEEAEEKPE